MKNLKDLINNSQWKTQERFSVAANIDEALLSKYCRGIRQPSQKHAEVIKRLLKKD
jgi:hypothetical protein